LGEGSKRVCVLAFSIIAFLLLATIAAQAVEPDEMLSDQRLEARARALSSELRCLVCQNQSIDESDAPLAKDLRLLIRERLKAGASDSEVRDFMVARYGDFVLLRPRFAPETLLLWVTPFALLLVGLIFAIRASRRRTLPGAAEAPLTEEERGKMEELGGMEWRERQ
jgi:cytochrome c-type biogenesis protein CcmH